MGVVIVMMVVGYCFCIDRVGVGEHGDYNLAPMDIEIDRQRIINQFKRNGHLLTKQSLEMVTDHLKSQPNPHRHLQQLVKKLNQMVIKQGHSFNEKTLKMGMQLLHHKSQTGQSFSSYKNFLDHINQWSIFNVSPYESPQRFFVEKPEQGVFLFQAADFLEMNKKRFKDIREWNLPKVKGTAYLFIGILFERFVGMKNKIMLQNQVNQVELVFPDGFDLQVFLIPGCTYIALGQLKSSQIQLIVHSLQLPQALGSQKESLMSQKLKFVFDKISTSKIGLNMDVSDFKKYEILYNKEQDKNRSILMFGNFRVTVQQIAKVRAIVEKFPHRIQAIVLFICQNGHNDIDLRKEFNKDIQVYIVPNLNSEGPRILPKIPILKHDFNSKVVTNPARFSIYSRECLFLNYPIVKNLYSQSLIPKEQHSPSNEEIAQKVAKMLYSQNNIGLTNKIFWRQSNYFNISTDSNIFISDHACPMVQYTGQGKGTFVSIGDFTRDEEFICYMPHSKYPIHLCASQTQ